MAKHSGQPVDIYIRVSKRGNRPDERFHSPEEQEQLARRYAESIGLTIGDVLPPDIDKSGGTVDREGIRAALERVRAGLSQGIVVAWIDRFSRDAAQAYDLLREFEAAGGRVFAPEAPEDVSSPEGELQLGMFLLIAQYQRKRAKASFERAAERATIAGISVAAPPLGYRKREDRRLEVDPITAPIVREAFERRASGNGGYTELARFISEATGRPYSRPGVRKIIRNRIYASGVLERDGVVSEHAAGAIVDEALWQAAQRVGDARRSGRDDRGGWLLTGLLCCGTCGNKLNPWQSAATRGGKRIKRYRRYRCVNLKCPHRVSVAANKIERLAVLQAVNAGRELATRASTPDLGALEDAVATAERRLEQVLAPDARDALGDLWAADVKARREERDLALARLGEARVQVGGPEMTFHLGDVWNEMSRADQRAMLALFWKEIRLSEGQQIKFIVRQSDGELSLKGVEE